MELMAAIEKGKSLTAEIDWLERVTDGKAGAHDRSPASLKAELYSILLEKKRRQKALVSALAKIEVVVWEEVE